MTQRERDDPGLTEMVLDAEPVEEQTKADAQQDKFREPPDGEDELPLTGQ
jgi:hypothetical protein